MADQFEIPEQDAASISPGQITLKVKVVLLQKDTLYQIKVHPSIPFRDFFETMVKSVVFANTNENQISSLADNIEIQFQNQNITPQEIRSLKQLDIKDQDIIYVRLKLKGG